MTLRPPQDPRWFQLATLGGLLIYGVGWLGFDLAPSFAVMLLASVVVWQALCTWAWRLPQFDPKSALISGCSLCLLLRTHSPVVAIAAAGLAVGSKFLLRWRGKHLFNPTNFALVALLLMSERQLWVSPGQWGNVAFFAFLMGCVGSMVVFRAMRSDVTMAFLVSYLALMFGYSLYLGEPLAIPLHRLQSGALLLFAFFMISDPKTTPDSRVGRLLFGFLVAWGGWYVQFRLFHTNGLLWSLALGSLVVPCLDWLLPARRYAWPERLHHSPLPHTLPLPNL